MKKIIAIILVSCFIFPQIAFTGAWTMPQNNLWIEESVKYSWAKRDFNPDSGLSRKLRDARSWGWSSITKAEYGLLENITVLGGFEYKEGHYKENDRPASWGGYNISNHDFTSMEIGSRVKILKDPVITSVQFRNVFYLGGKRFTDPIAASPTHPSEDRPSLSDGNNLSEFRLLLGKKFGTKIPFYLGTEFGYGFSDNSVCNTIPILVEGGFWPVSWILIKSELDGFWSHDGTGNLEKDLLTWRIGPTFRLKGIKGKETSGVTREGSFLDLSLQYGNVIWGRNTSADQEVIVKVSFQF